MPRAEREVAVAAKKSYKVTGALVQVVDQEGRAVQLMYGAPLPEYVDADEVKRLEEMDLVGSDDKDEVVPGLVPTDL
jgi:hypothetical protein